MTMHKWMMIFCLLTILTLFCFSCAWSTKESSKDTGIRCPKCGAFYSSKEGAEMFQSMGGREPTRR
jgi:hypothetical protein